MNKKLLILLIILVISGVFGYKFLFHEHRDIGSENTEFLLSVKELQHDFAKNDSLANAKYSDHTVEVMGTVTAIDIAANSVTIDQKLSAVLKEKLGAEIKLKSAIKIKGRFVGYDDLLDEFKMDQISILK